MNGFLPSEASALVHLSGGAITLSKNTPANTKSRLATLPLMFRDNALLRKTWATAKAGLEKSPLTKPLDDYISLLDSATSDRDRLKIAKPILPEVDASALQNLYVQLLKAYVKVVNDETAASEFNASAINAAKALTQELESKKLSITTLKRVQDELIVKLANEQALPAISEAVQLAKKTKLDLYLVFGWRHLPDLYARLKPIEGRTLAIYVDLSAEKHCGPESVSLESKKIIEKKFKKVRRVIWH